MVLIILFLTMIINFVKSATFQIVQDVNYQFM